MVQEHVIVLIVVRLRWKTRWRVDVGVLFRYVAVGVVRWYLAIVVPKPNGKPLTCN
jgi:hypothetical protein